MLPHFRLHYHDGAEAAADRITELAEPALERIGRLLGHVPEEPIHVVLTDETDGSNGFAQALPRNQITMYLGVPEPFGTLGDFDDYLSLLFIHELTHVVHLDTVGGLAAWLNAVLGKTFSPNQLQPRWFIEGLAVYVESRLSSGGRVRSALVDMFMREQILAERFLAIDELSTQTRRFPGGGVAWDFGGRFVDFIARRHGEDALAEISHAYGARFVPYGLNSVARQATGEDFVELWAAWRAEEEARAAALLTRLAAEGADDAASWPRPAAEVYRPRFGRDGSLVLVESPRDGDAELVVLGPDGRSERGRFRTSNGAAALTPDGRRVVAATVEIERTYFTFGDLEIIDLESGARRRRTRGARLDQPDVSPDGRTIAAVAQGQGRTWLVVLPLDGDAAPAPLFVPGPGEQVAAPRFSPDGEALAFSLAGSDGSRRIARLELAGGALSLLTAPRAQDLDPVWSPDGQAIYFASDRGGLFNIHRVDGAGRLERVSHVRTGAFEPAVDPTSGALVFVRGRFEGYELATLPAGSAPRAPIEGRPRPSATATVSVAPAEEEPYQRWESLMPRAYLPTTGFDGLGETLGVLLTGVDALAQHVWQLRLEYGFASQRLGYAFFYSNRTLWTPFFLSSGLVTTARPASFAPPPELERRESIWRASMGFDLPLSRWDVAAALSLRYSVELRRGPRIFSDDPFQPSPAGPGDATYSSLALSASFGSARGSADAISPERGVGLDVSAEMHDPALGSDVRVLLFSAHGTAYVTPPWRRHHVLALRAGFGASAGDPGNTSVYVLGGLPVRNVLRDVLDGGRVGIDAVRGYGEGAFRGNAFVLLSAEYRLPLLSVERGLYSLPAFVDRLYGVAFVDAGATPRGPLRLADAKVGLGIELRLELVLAYYLPYTLRLGYARGLAEEGIHNAYLGFGFSY